MSRTTPPTITPSPVAPDRADRATFSPRAAAWADWVKNHAVAEIAAVATNVYDNAVDAFSSATTATAKADLATTNGAAQVALAAAQAGHAAASAAAAAATAGAEPWVSGQVYAQYAACVSLIDAQTYRRTTAAGSGIIDPKNDTANYVRISMSTTGSDESFSGYMFKDCGYTVIDKGNISGATVTFDYTGGSIQTFTATGSTVTLATSNWPPTGNLGELLIVGTNMGAYTMSFPSWIWTLADGTTTTSVSTFLAQNGTRTAFRASGVDKILLITRDAGTTVYASLVAI